MARLVVCLIQTVIGLLIIVALVAVSYAVTKLTEDVPPRTWAMLAAGSIGGVFLCICWALGSLFWPPKKE